MRLEDRIVRALDDRWTMLDLPAGDLEGALRLGGRVRRRRRLVAGAVGWRVAVLASGSLLLAPDRRTDPSPPLPTAPGTGSPRRRCHRGWVR